MNNRYRYEGIIWDFNGTLLDDVTICLDSINALLQRRSYPLLSEERYKEIFGFPVKLYYEKIGFNFQKEKWTKVANEYMKEYWDRQHYATLFKGIPNLLQQFSSKGLSHFVLSAMEQNNLQRFLSQLDATHYFKEVAGISNDLADGKIESGLRMVSKTGISKKKLVMIGDTTHDFEVAQEMGIDCILFSGGHQSEKRLQEMQCPVINNHQDLLSYINVD